MARQGVSVTWKEPDHDRIPDALNEGVAFVLDLDQRNVLEPIRARLHIRRQGGYCGFDVLLFLLVFFAAGCAEGIRAFWERVRPFNRKLAAIAGRKRMASPASLSRALSAVEPELLRPASEWLLSEGAGIDEVLRHPSVLAYDARGEGWHVFDFDPTVTTLRHRALPESEDLPAPRRRSEQTAAPGYPGRKRGDVQFRRGTVQHAGSSAWLQAMLGPGNGDGHAELEAALGVVVRTCERLDHPLSRTLFRMDGEFGWVPYFAACRAQGVSFISRLTRPELFDQPDVLRTLHEGTWLIVPDSLSGPRRSALDLGVVTVPPGENTRKEDGTAYEPVAVRVVASRYPRTEKAKHGRIIDGWQVELFAVDVAADALPAPEAVAMYFGHAGQENGFAQEDRELGLDRIFSYHMPGQELAVVVGLWMWNLRLVRGFELSPPPALHPEQEPYKAEVDLRGLEAATDASTDVSPCIGSPKDAQASSPTTLGDAVPCDSPVQEALLGNERPGEMASSGQASSETASVSVDSGPAEAEHTLKAAEDDVVETLRSIDWNHCLRRRPGWSWDATTGHLLCIDGRELVLTTVRNGELVSGRTGIIFCRPVGGCDPCDARASCLHSVRPRASKHLEIFVPTPIAVHLRELLHARRQGRKDVATRLPRRSARSRRTFTIVPLMAVAAQFAVLPSLFLPAAARALSRAAARGLTVRVTVIAPLLPQRPALIAESVADKQRRRKTWQQNVDRYALTPQARVHVEIAGGDALRQMLGEYCDRAPS